MPTILLATRNPGKVREIVQMTAGLACTWRGLAEFPEVTEVEETGTTFVENARLKALYYAAATRLAAVADDSGLEVEALGGAPGVHSAYYAGRPRDDAANNRKLIAALAAVPAAQRTARFRCVMVLARPGRVLCEAAGAVEGRIELAPRGANGFGYDPHFLVPDLGRTLAELPPEQKNAISHRGRALRALLERLPEVLEELD